VSAPSSVALLQIVKIGDRLEQCARCADDEGVAEQPHEEKAEDGVGHYPDEAERAPPGEPAKLATAERIVVCHSARAVEVGHRTWIEGRPAPSSRSGPHRL